MVWWNKYYIEHKHRMESSGGDSHAEREPQNVLRIAMIMRVAERGSKILDPDILERSFKIMTMASSGSIADTQSITTNDRGQLQFRIIDYIRKSGGTRSRSQITKRFYGTARGKDIEDAMDTLEKMAGLVVKFSNKGILWYRLSNIKGEHDA